MWFTYTFWNHDWVAAIAVVLVTRVIALYSVINIDTEAFAQTTLGKVGLLHLNPVNLSVQLVGSLGLLYGLWEHSTEWILGGLSVVLLGHLFGWSQVDSRLGEKAD